MPSRRGSREKEAPRHPGRRDRGQRSPCTRWRCAGRTGPEVAPDRKDRDKQKEGAPCQKCINSKAKRWSLCPSGGAGPQLSLAHKNKVQMKVTVAQSCPTLRDPVDGSPSGSSVHGILQARILKWVAIPFSWEGVSSWPGDRTQVSCIAGRFFTIWASQENRWTSSDLSCDGETQAPIRTWPGDTQRVSHKSQH